MPRHASTVLAVGGEEYVRPPPMPFPACHIFINHKYKYIFITHPKSASTAIKVHLVDCRFNATAPHCMSILEDGDLATLRAQWADYFVFTFVRNPWARLFSSWKFLRMRFMKHPAVDKVVPEECLGAEWRDFCADPVMLGRMCREFPQCCK